MFLWFFGFVTRACCDENLFRESSLWPKKCHLLLAVRRPSRRFLRFRKLVEQMLVGFTVGFTFFWISAAKLNAFSVSLSFF